jgi:hypothetical protein
MTALACSLQEWKSLAQLVREFQTKTPPRFRRVPRNTQPVTSHFSPHTTEPKVRCVILTPLVALCNSGAWSVA